MNEQQQARLDFLRNTKEYQFFLEVQEIIDEAQSDNADLVEEQDLVYAS